MTGARGRSYPQSARSRAETFFISELHGQTYGLKASQIRRLEGLYKRKLPRAALVTQPAPTSPAGHRATWFALMASFMNLALVAGQLGTKYLNIAFPVDKGHYAKLPALTLTVIAIGLAVPLATLLLLGRRVEPRDESMP